MAKKKRTPKFGTAAFRKMYGPGGTKRKNKARRKTAKRKTTKKRATKRTRRVMNPPRKWTMLRGVKKFRVLKGRGGNDVLEFGK